jgi:hypothetical protein
VHPLPVSSDDAKSNGGGNLVLGGGALLEKLEQRSNPSLLDDHFLVAVVVARERPELIGGVGTVLRLAHLDGGDEGPDPGEDGVVAGDGREGEVSASVGVEDRKQPLHVADGGLQEADHPLWGGSATHHIFLSFFWFLDFFFLKKKKK